MKIEAEVHGPLDTLSSPAERGKWGCGGGCSVSGGELPPIAQDASIGRPDPQQPGCGPAQNAFDCEHFQFIDEDDDEDLEGPPTRLPDPTPDAPAGQPPEGEHRPAVNGHDMSESIRRQKSVECDCGDRRELKSLLKKSNSGRRNKGRVTFDEAVTLYSDENEGIQLLQLTTGPDILCADVFYFEPPIEYQDVPPFEPPAEYRDAAEQQDTVPVEFDDVAAESVDVDQDLQLLQQQNGVPCECTCAQEIMAAKNNKNAVESVPPQQQQQQPAQEISETIVPNDTANDSDIIVDTGITTVAPEPRTVQLESTKESDKLFERFLEAEREFAVDEELNSVFQELDSDFANDINNGALDDNFFRKLITLLSSAEGDTLAVDGDIFSTTKFSSSIDDGCHETEDDDSSQTHSRTLSEADSDCSISSQDTIIVRLGEDGPEQQTKDDVEGMSVSATESECSDSGNGNGIVLQKRESFDEVFSEKITDISAEEKPRPLPRESLLMMKNVQTYQLVKDSANEESLSRQSSGEQSVNSGNSQDHPQDADDSTSSDSRSGEVEEEIRLDDIGYDEEDAEDYDEESFRGMAHGNSKIRRIIKKNALQCTLFRGIEAKRRQQPGTKYPRPKSPLLSQESLVEKLKWLTTIDEQKDAPDGRVNFHSKPPDVILSTGGIPVNGTMSSVDDMHNKSAMAYQQQQFYQMQRFPAPPNSKGAYYVRHDSYHPSLPRQKPGCPGHPQQVPPHGAQYRFVSRPGNPQGQWPPDQRNMASMTVPRNFRDWRVIQRATVSRGDVNSRSQVPADYVRCSNGAAVTYAGGAPPPDVSRSAYVQARSNPDELEQFVEQDSKRLERIRKRYSLAEDEDDPTFGFARRPSVRGVQNRIPPNPSDSLQGPNKLSEHYVVYEEPSQGPPGVHPRMAPFIADQMRLWNRDPNWRPDPAGSAQIYGQYGRSQMPMHIHRASVALTELPGNATIPYTHRKPQPDPRYHSYAESMYGSTRTLLTKGWVPPPPPPDPRSCHNVSHPAGTLQGPMPPASSQMLQVPPVVTSDERGVPEGASSSPNLSSDSLYHSPVPDSIAPGSTHKDEGVIYYSLNV